MKLKNNKFTSDEKGIEEMSQFFISTIDIKYNNCPNDGISVIFLAGSPGSGKTEFIDNELEEKKKKFFIIDIDIYRCMFEGYNGGNADLYQKACVKVADKLFSYGIKHNINIIFDGTFRSKSKVEQNLNLCNKYNRKVLIFYIFQDPFLSYFYTFLRKLDKKRNVPIDVFVDGFYEPIRNVFYTIEKFNFVKLYICQKKVLNSGKINFLIRSDYDT